VHQLAAFGLTLATELPWYVAGLTLLRLARWWQAALLGLGVNLASHPLLWWALAPHPTVSRFAVAEFAVLAFETFAIFLFVRRELPLVAVVCLGANATSVLAGLLIG